MVTPITPVWIVTERFWGESGHVTIGVGGEAVAVTMDGSHPTLPAYSNWVVLDGFGVWVLQAAAAGWSFQVLSAGLSKYFGARHDAFAGLFSGHLDAILSSKNINYSVNGTFAQNDVVYMSVWGHYLQEPTVAEPQEVTVKGVQFFPRKKVSGPV